MGDEDKKTGRERECMMSKRGECRKRLRASNEDVEGMDEEGRERRARRKEERESRTNKGKEE